MIIDLGGGLNVEKSLTMRHRLICSHTPEASFLTVSQYEESMFLFIHSDQKTLEPYPQIVPAVIKHQKSIFI